MRNKNIDFEELARELDISPTMHKYAVERYRGLSDYLQEKGINAKFYPQGSFRTGTVVRPLVNGVESDYDIDVVCELDTVKSETAPQYVKQVVGAAISEDKTYRDKLLPEDSRCWTLQYADVVDTIGLKLDVVPSSHEDAERIRHLIELGIEQKQASQAIVITEKRGTNSYFWLPSNPGGYGDWFDGINDRFLKENIAEKKAAFFRENRHLFAAMASVEDVPDYYLRTTLQRVIQILKRHRDLFYERSDKTGKLKPASVIITTLAAQIARSSPSTRLDDLLTFVVSGIDNYVSLLRGVTPMSRFSGERNDFILKQGRKWIIANPVNPEDNYADSWTDETASMFFRWVNAIQIDLVQTSPDKEKQYWAGMQAGLGTKFVDRALPHDPNEDVSGIEFKAQPLQNPTKPWSRG